MPRSATKADARRGTRQPAIGIVAPSGFLTDPDALDRAAALFAARGWRVQAGETCFARWLRFAGDDDLRAAEWQRFCTDRTLDIVLAARGGYGFSRILDRLDFAALRATARPIVGYSDFTAFSLAYLARVGGVSFQGPAVTDFAASPPNAETLDDFFAALAGDHQIRFDTDATPLRVRGRLWGGNLAMICALLGTPFFPRVRGGILFVEDVNEPAYRIERLLLQLHHAGVFARQRAIVLGSFAPVPAQANDNGFDLDAVIATLRGLTTTPVLTGLPFGHVARKATLPVGTTAALEVSGGTASLSWRHPFRRSSTVET